MCTSLPATEYYHNNIVHPGKAVMSSLTQSP